MIIRHWSEIPERPLLPAGECQLWQAWLDEENPDSFRGLLSEDERIRAGRLRGLRGADRFTVGRGILRSIIGRYLSRRPEELIFAYGVNGKPMLMGDVHGRLSFNVSHAGSLAIFVIVSGFEVGVDVEEIYPISDLEATASIIMSDDELAEFKGLPASVKLDRFFTTWTSKEAILKAFGDGFHGPVKDALKTFSQPDRLILFQPAEGFKGALACV
jgi:4'-phosphopantetheinyl transferase